MRCSDRFLLIWLRCEKAALWVGLACVAIAIVLALAGCQTYEAVTKAPPDFWQTAQSIVVALFADVTSIVRWFF